MQKFKTFLTVIGAVTILVLAANSAVYAATGGKFILGKTNKANTVSTLKRTTPGSALSLVTKSSSNAPLSTNGKGKVTNLNADKLDGMDSSAFAPYPKLTRGVYSMSTNASGSGTGLSTGISFGWTLPAAPVTHYIAIGDPVPAGCSGTAAAPNASPGNLCVFERFAFGPMGGVAICDSTANNCPSADRWGASMWSYTTASGLTQTTGTWAVRAASVSSARIAPSTRTAPLVSGPGGR